MPGRTAAEAYRSTNASPFPAQIRFTTVSNYSPLPERCFEHIVDYEGSSSRFHFELRPTQVVELLSAFRAHEDSMQHA